jgi:hypothetical protein
MYGPLHHVYLTAHARMSYAPWIGEEAQIGLRIPFANRPNGPDHGSIWVPEANGDVTSQTGVTTGTHGQLSETWTARVGAVGSTDNADPAFQVNLAEHFWTFLDASKAYFGTGLRWTHVKVAPIGLTGDYEAGASTYSFSSELAGTGTAILPPNVALACSLRAPIIGKRGRGRFYLPAITASQCAADGTAVSTMRDALSTNFKALIDAIQGEFTTGQHQPIVSVFSPGATTVIRPSEVRIGNQFDTQQRRRAQVPETYDVLSL